MLVSCAEYLVDREPLRDSGLTPWSVARLRYRITGTGLSGFLLDLVLRYPVVLGLVALQGALAAITLAGPETMICSGWLLLAQAGLAWLFLLRNRYGHDGADQMTSIAYASLGMACAVPTPLVQRCCLWFLTAQLCLSYLVSGLAKVPERGWRDGSYLTGVCGLRMYGNPRLAEFLSARPALARWLSRGILAWEIAFVLVLVLPMPAALAFLAAGLVFHLLIAVIMGLNSFVWSFPAIYPAALFCIRTRGW
jgi:hypothetical protein